MLRFLSGGAVIDLGRSVRKRWVGLEAPKERKWPRRFPNPSPGSVAHERLQHRDASRLMNALIVGEPEAHPPSSRHGSGYLIILSVGPSAILNGGAHQGITLRHVVIYTL